jgi:hypothetical protein
VHARMKTSPVSIDDFFKFLVRTGRDSNVEACRLCGQAVDTSHGGAVCCAECDQVRTCDAAVNKSSKYA